MCYNKLFGTLLYQYCLKGRHTWPNDEISIGQREDCTNWNTIEHHVYISRLHMYVHHVPNISTLLHNEINI